MTETRNFNALNLTTIPFDEQACVFENRFILAGDLDDTKPPRDLTHDPSMLPFLTTPYPFKIQFAMAHLCLSGSMRVRLNLNEYELHRNSLLIVTPGSIGQCLELSPDCRIILVALSSDYVITESNSEGALIVRKFLAQQSILQLTDTQTAEILALYRALYDKLRRPDFRFKDDVLKGYLQVLYSEICQLMGFAQETNLRPLRCGVAAALHHGTQHPVLCRPVVPDAEIPLAGGVCRQRTARRRMDTRLCDSGGQGLIEKRAIYDPTGFRHAEFRQPVVFRRLLQESRRLLPDRLQGDVSAKP